MMHKASSARNVEGTKIVSLDNWDDEEDDNHTEEKNNSGETEDE